MKQGRNSTVVVSGLRGGAIGGVSGVKQGRNSTVVVSGLRGGGDRGGRGVRSEAGTK